MSVKKRQQAPKAPAPVHEEVATPAPSTPDIFDKIGNKAVYLALGLLVLMAFFVYKDYLLFHNAYYFKDIGSDSYNYSYAVTHGVADYMAKHGWPSWSWSMGMGQSIFPFFLRDPFDLLLFLSGSDSIIFGTAWKEFSKIILSGVVFFYYLRYVGLTAYTSVLGSLLFSFCAFMVLGGGWFLFSFETFNLAVLLLGFEMLFSRGKWLVFTFGIFLIFLSQPFNMYVYGLFLAGYAVLRMVQAGGYDMKSGALLFAKMAGAGVLGILISGPFMLENVVQLLESPRGSGNTSYASILKAAPMFGTVDQFQLGTAVTRFFSSDLLGAGSNFKGWQNTLEAPLFYCGIPCLLLMPQVFPFLQKKVRIFFIAFLAFWLMPIVFPYFRYAFWLFTGDYYRAYSIVVAMFLMYYALMAMDLIIRNRKVNLVVLIVTVVVLFLLLNYPFFPDRDVINSAVFTFVCFFILVYGGLLYMLGKKDGPAYIKYILLGVVVFELTYMSGITVNDRDPITAEELTEKKGYNDYTVDALKFIQASDESFYRVDKSYASSPAIHFSLNDAQAQGYYGTCGYNPFNQLYYIRYLQLVGVSDRKSELDSRWARGLMGRPMLESANRVKYMLDKNNAVPLWRLIGDSIAQFGDVKVFRNRLLLPFGFTYKQYIKESAYDALSNTQKDFVSLAACVVPDEDVSKIKGMTEYSLQDTVAPSMFTLDLYAQRIADLGRDSMTAATITDTKISGKVNLPEDKMLYLSVPYDGGWTLKVDGKEQPKQIVFAGMTGVMLSRGQHSIEMEYGLRYFNKGLLMSVLGIVLCAVLWFLTRKKGEDVPQTATE